MKNITSVKILFIGKQEADHAQLKEALRTGKIRNALYGIADEPGLDKFICGINQGEKNGRPDIIIFDLLFSGKQNNLIDRINNEPLLKEVPVIFLGTSSAQENILNKFSLGKKVFIQKPVDFQKLTATIRQMEDFWFTIIKVEDV